MTRHLAWMLPAWMLCAPAFAQQPAQQPAQEPAQETQPPAASFKQLLEKIRGDYREDLEQRRKRESRFAGDRDRQAQAVAAARRRLDQLTKESAALEARFDDNEEKLLELRQLHRQRAGDLEELSAVVVRSVADIRATLAESFITLLLPGADGQLAALMRQDGLPDLAGLEDLWYLMTEIMTLQGGSHRFEADVILSDGRRERREVTGIGPFTAVSQGRFLKYLPESRGLADLARQPASRYLAAAAAVSRAGAGSASTDADFVAAPVDPSRGAILATLVQAPTLIERIEQGGWIAYLILALGLAGLLLAAERIVSLTRAVGGVRRQKDAPELSQSNPLGRVLGVSREHDGADVESLELSLHDAVIREMPPLERGLGALKVLAAIAPLLGLLGTVVGMIETFQAITLFGTGDPRTMAGGISQALVTTALGLMVAVPLLLLHTFAAARSREIRQILEEQSAGIVALHARREAGGAA